MSLDSSEVLEYLVRSGIWSKKKTLSSFKHVILDAESVVKYIYRMCIKNHLRRQKNSVDLCSATLINYIEFSNHVKTIFDYLLDNRIVPIVVYEGKLMEMPLFGPQAAKYASSQHQVTNLVSLLSDHNDSRKRNDIDQLIKKLNPPNLTLNMFKTIVNMRRRLGLPVQTHQAFYSASPLMTKMARDHKCPIITNNCDLILMDVRAGFILLDEFWSKHISSHLKSPKLTAQISRSVARLSTISAKPSTVSRIPENHIKCRFNYHSMFIHQHPGLNQISAALLFPLTTTDFIGQHSKSLVRLNILRDSCSFKDLHHPHSVTPKQVFRMHHNSASRLESAIFFLTTKDVDVVGHMIRGEEQRVGSTLYNDYRQLYNYHLIACDFRKRLKIILKFTDDPAIFKYIEQCFTMRESTSVYLINLICCAVGRVASFSFNKSIQFECLRGKHSAYYILDESKRILMSLFSANQAYKSEFSRYLKGKQRESISKYSTATLTVIDREYSKIVERSIPTIYNDDQLNLIRDRFQLTNIAKHTVTKQEKVALFNLIFRTQNLTQLPSEINEIVIRHLETDEHHIKIELSIVLSLFRYCFYIASQSDKNFRNMFWSVAQHMENALVEHYLYRNYTLIGGKTSLGALVELITNNNFESVEGIKPTATKGELSGNVSNLTSTKTVSPASRASRSPTRKSTTSINSHAPSMSSSITTKSPKLSPSRLRGSIRHLIELLNTSLEGYYELNAFLDYPLPKLNLHIHYNPILLYNLSIHSFEQIN